MQQPTWNSLLNTVIICRCRMWFWSYSMRWTLCT